jgi:hypothetical protein
MKTQTTKYNGRLDMKKPIRPPNEEEPSFPPIYGWFKCLTKFIEEHGKHVHADKCGLTLAPEKRKGTRRCLN